MDSPTPYSIDTQVRYGPLERIDVAALAEACSEQWFNQTLCQVNDCVVRLGVMQGEFHSKGLSCRVASSTARVRPSGLSS